MTPGSPERAYLDALLRLKDALMREADAVQSGAPTTGLCREVDRAFMAWLDWQHGPSTRVSV